MTIDDMMDAIDGMKAALEKLDSCEDSSIRIALAHCVRALRYAKDADGLAPSRRREARSAYRMGCAALGLEDAA